MVDTGGLASRVNYEASDVGRGPDPRDTVAVRRR
jgi:hypothetical protein